MEANSDPDLTFLAKSDYPSRRHPVSVPHSTLLRELLAEAAAALDLSTTGTERYSSYCIACGEDVVELTEDKMEKSIGALGLKDKSTLFFNAPHGIRPLRVRKKKAKAKDEEAPEKDRYKGFSYKNVYRRLLSTSKSKVKLSYEFFDIYAKELLPKTGFSNLPQNIVDTLILRDTLSGKEVDIFRALMEWGSRHMTSSNEGGGEVADSDAKAEEEREEKNDDTKGKNEKEKKGSGSKDALKSLLGPMMRHVRFPLMTVADLASHVEPSGILDEQQCLDLFTWKGLNSGKTKKSKLPASLSDFQSKERTPRKPPAWFKFDLNKKHASLLISSDGMTVTSTKSNVYQPAFGDTVLEKGVHEWEILLEQKQVHAYSCNIGVCPVSFSNFTASLMIGYQGHIPAWAFATGQGQKYYSGHTSYGSVCQAGDYVGVKLDLDAKTIEFFRNGKSLGVAFTGVSGPCRPCISLYGNTKVQLRFPSSVHLSQ